MESQSIILFAALAIVKATVLVVVPVVMTTFIWSGLGRLVPAGFFQMPLIYTFSRVVGLGTGLALVYAHKGGAYYDLHLMFMPESPWNTTFWLFISERVNPLNFGPGAIYERLGGGGYNILFTMIMALLAIIFLMAIGSCLKAWRGVASWRAIAGATVVTVWMAYVTIYALSLMFWLMFILNSWTFLLLALIVQYYRHRSFGEH